MHLDTFYNHLKTLFVLFDILMYQVESDFWLINYKGGDLGYKPDLWTCSIGIQQKFIDADNIKSLYNISHMHLKILSFSMKKSISEQTD